ncbi:MAG: FtsW/RodA/SpoVE family cell cycle protein [Clostridia bacterium]|nr:FtsW/RodA/SpoVE family cell cycle protein [Clostridia bacterium]
MKRRKSIDPYAMKSALFRLNPRLILTSVMLFQFTAMIIVAIKTSPIDLQALIMAIALPVGTYVSVRVFGAIWPVDRTIMILTILLLSIGLVTLQDIARSSETPFNQAMFIIAGFFAMAFGIVFVRRLVHWDRWMKWFMCLAGALIVAPLILGEWTYGAKNWVSIPGTGYSVQPSEFVKPILIVILAAGFANQPRTLKCLPTAVFAAALCAILLLEHDLGALLVYFILTVAVFYAATSNAPLTLAGLAAGASGAVIAYNMFDYVAKRVEVFLDPWSDPLDNGWQIIQALIAIGSGGLFGMGVGLGYPRNIPLYHSDFIFAAICEEFGLIFAIGMLAIYVILIMRGISVALSARLSFHALIAFGVVTLIGFQTLIIVGGNIKLIPLTGVTLPFVSAGGSSIISMMGCIGLLLGVSSINAADELDDYKRMMLMENGI